MIPAAHVPAAKQRRIVTAVHAFMACLAIGVLGISLYRMFNKNIQRTRNSTWPLGVSAKSLGIMAYEELTMNISGLRRFGSLKAYMVLNIIEVIFWIAAVVLTIMGLTQNPKCHAVGCTLSYIVIAIAVTLAIIGLPLALLSIQHFRHARSGHLDEKHETAAAMPSSLPAATYTQQPYAAQPQRPGVVAGGETQWRSNSDLEKQGVYTQHAAAPHQPGRSYQH